MLNLERRSGRSKCSLEFTDFLLVLWCCAQMRRLSNVKPRYLTKGVAGIMMLLNETEGQSSDLSEKVIKKSYFYEIFCSGFCCFVL